MTTSRSGTTVRMSLSRATLFAALAAGAGLWAASCGASAQVSQPRDAPQPETGEVPQVASPRGATYIPGVGFRFVPPLGPRVYGYYYGPRVYGWYDDRETRRYRHGYRHSGYRARKVTCNRESTWYGDRCVRRFP